MEYFLKSKRLGFRRWAKEDFPLALELWGDPQVTELIGGPFTYEEVRARLANEIHQLEEWHIQYWPIFLLEGDQHVGCAGLRPYSLNMREREIGFHLRPASWGQGLATEAAGAVVEYAFDTLGVEFIFAGHHPLNKASSHVLGKLGFIYTADEFYAPMGIVEPTYSLSKMHWRPQQK
jgi:RimJ/RimL family protein N-acetyltransferase